MLSILLQNGGGIGDSQILTVVKSVRIIWIGILILLAFDMNITTTMTRAQEISLTTSDDVCGCSASTYTFVLDFSLSCPPSNITTGSGVGSVSCLISPFGARTNKLDPVVLDSVSILELDQANNVLVEERIGGELVNGGSFSYSSIINNQEEETSIQNIPKALQLNLSGRNEDGVMLMNVFVITFTNECGVTPVIQVGESAGWVVFSQMNGPIPRFCPTVAPSSTPSKAPTRNPTQQPTQQPSSPPTQFPTRKPIANPTSQPTKLSSDEPTQSLTEPPTQEPIGNPTSKPTRLPGNEPIGCPTEPPTKSPTGNPTSQPTKGPTFKLTGAHTLFPTKAPTKPPFLPTKLSTGSPTKSSFLTSSGSPSIFESSMSMPLSISFDLKYSLLLGGENELIEDFLSD